MYKLICSLAVFSVIYSPTILANTLQSQTHKKRALVIGLDGTTGNQFHNQVWKNNKAPELKELQQYGIYTICESDTDPRCAKAHSGHHTGTDYYWLTAPGWASVISGVDNTKHLVKDNEDNSLKKYSETAKDYPSFFMRAKKYGLQTAAAGVAAFISSNNKNKKKYGIIDYECGSLQKGPAVEISAEKSCNLDYRKSFNNNNKLRDNELTSWLIEKINNPVIDIIMGVYDGIDSTGHSFGFDNNKNYLNAISVTSKQVGLVLNAVKNRSSTYDEEWIIILTSDHGGHRLLAWGMHGSVANEDEVIPFSVTLIGSQQKLNDLSYPVSHLDVHPTLMKWFDISSFNTDGKVQGL